jgi:predicted amidohydrolase YtcJ
VSEPVPVLVSVPALILKPVLTLMLRLTLVLALGCHPALAASSATTLLLHGHIYTGDPRRPWVTALAVDATRISAVGSDAEIARLRDYATGDLAELRLYAALRDRGELTLRTRTSFGSVAVRHRLSAQFLSDLDEARSLYHDDWVAANLVKFFADGSTGLVPPLVYTPQEYSALALEFDRRGFQLMTHALREDSVHMILDTYEHIQQAHGTRDTPAERIDVEAAVRAYTRGSAYAAFFDDRVGTLEVGKLADLAVLSQDIFAIEPTAIGATRVTLTMVGGKVVYRGP